MDGLRVRESLVIIKSILLSECPCQDSVSATSLPREAAFTQMPVLNSVSYGQGHRVPLHQAEQEQMPVALFTQMGTV